MPENESNYRTSADSITFAANLLPIGYAIDCHSQSVLGERESRDQATVTIFKITSKSKDEMITLINSTFDEPVKSIKRLDISEFDDALDYFGLNRTKRQIL